MILLPQFSKCKDYRCEPISLVSEFIFFPPFAQTNQKKKKTQNQQSEGPKEWSKVPTQPHPFVPDLFQPELMEVAKTPMRAVLLIGNYGRRFP